ncbi:MAG: hypothetical protein P8164_07620 [Gammaproteobacteria bacterium]
MGVCGACHATAKDATFDEDAVAVPGKRKWTWQRSAGPSAGPPDPGGGQARQQVSS